ncbi:hypothetical protein ITX31_00410 [Arthrobacter gandavensis]|uniref:hypothetical protein n=1 Tax=Arthrobacter gandavensis TaxID=169960 RepID=UPI00188EB1D5|nr:hypothetical protein [Arthrobacter gandavensis]MBF4992574.1 hypothetical protein [Arthrobacter gandavensis]
MRPFDERGVRTGGRVMSWRRFWIITAVCVALVVLAIILLLDGDDINDPEFMCRFGMDRRSVCDQS